MTLVKISYSESVYSATSISGGAWDGQNLNCPPFPGYNFNWINVTYGHIIQYIHITHY